MKNMNTLLSIAIAAMMISGAFMVLGPTVVAKSTPIADPEPRDLGYKIREQQFDPTLLSQNGNTADNAVPGDYWIVGNMALYYTGAYPNGYGRSSYMWFTLRVAEGNCEIWTANDMLFPSGDPRNAFTSRISITDEQAQYMADQFNDDIYPPESQCFSTPPPLNGNGSYFESLGIPESRLFRTHVEGRTMIMVFNIVDDSFFDPSYPYYISGFYSPRVDFNYARNIINVDVWDWANRTGPQPLNPGRSYLYEAVVAHEYQHLLHDYLKPADPLWINEGFSMYTQMLCGYGIPAGDIARYLYNPSNALTVWGDQGDINILADYGVVALFMIYVNDHFGGPTFFSTFMQNPTTGLAGISSTLAEVGYWQWTFNTAFKAWRLANLIRADTPGNGLYNYVSVDLNEIQPLNVNAYSARDGTVLRSEFLGPTITWEGYDTGVATLNAYSVDYYKVSDFSGLAKITNRFLFAGQSDIYAPHWSITAVDEEDYWYSGTGFNEVDQQLVASLSLGGEPVFEFDTMWALEEYWDYGFVQVSEDDGATWTSVEYEYTTYEINPSAYPIIVENLPGITGASDGLVHVTLDLSAYANEDVLLSFRYMTDWGTTFDGWYVNNFVLDGQELPLDLFAPIYQIDQADYTVTLYFPATEVRPARITDVPIFRVTDTGVRYLAWFSGYTEAYIIVSPNNGPVDYAFYIGEQKEIDPPPSTP